MRLVCKPSCPHQRPAPPLATPQLALPNVATCRGHRILTVVAPRVRGTALECKVEALSSPDSLTSDVDADTEWVSVGVIGPPHGIKGEMKVKPTTDFPKERLGTPGDRWLQAPSAPLMKRETTPVKMKLRKGYAGFYKGHHLWIIKLKGVDTPEQADALRGHSILIPAHSRGQLEDGDFYVQDLVGLDVFEVGASEALGTICDVYDGSGGCDLLMVKTSKDENRTFWVPFSEQLVPVVDLKGGKIEIDPVDGLLDLADDNERKPKRKRRPRSRNRRKQLVPDPAREN